MTDYWQKGFNEGGTWSLRKRIVSNRSHLENCCPVWNPHKVGDIEHIEGVQRTITSKIEGMKDLDYWDCLKALQLMS